jgi:hypothetical protein
MSENKRTDVDILLLLDEEIGSARERMLEAEAKLQAANAVFDALYKLQHTLKLKLGKENNVSARS